MLYYIVVHSLVYYCLFAIALFLYSDRILNMALSPRRTRVISAGADETLRIWRCFDVPKSQSSRPTQNDSLSTALLEGMY